jgi:serine/threonine protein kinase
MTVLFCSKTNQAVTLTVSIAHSGEGEVWQTDRPGLLAKIYHVPESHEAEKLTQMKDRVAKLEVMVKRVPKDPNAHQNHISFAWPRSLLKNSSGEVVGFLMAEVENSLDLLKVCTPRMRKSLGVDANWYFLHVVARNIAGIIQAIHDEGYVLGDIKLQNILVNNRALPTIIDTDSFQVVDPVQNKVYRCLVASEGFTPSELIGKDIDSISQSAVHDRFRLGVVIYYLLFGGPPFRGSWQGSGDPPEQVELIRRGFWPYAPNSLIQPSNNTIPLDIIHPELQRCFLLCFNDGHSNPSKRPSARVWLEALEVAFNELQSCGKVDSHFYGLSYGRCYWCDRVQYLGVDVFQGIEIISKSNNQLNDQFFQNNFKQKFNSNSIQQTNKILKQIFNFNTYDYVNILFFITSALNLFFLFSQKKYLIIFDNITSGSVVFFKMLSSRGIPSILSFSTDEVIAFFGLLIGVFIFAYIPNKARFYSPFIEAIEKVATVLMLLPATVLMLIGLVTGTVFFPVIGTLIFMFLGGIIGIFAGLVLSILCYISIFLIITIVLISMPAIISTIALSLVTFILGFMIIALLWMGSNFNILVFIFCTSTIIILYQIAWLYKKIIL